MRLYWTPRFRADLDRIWLFLSEGDMALADRIERTIRSRAEVLADYPKLGDAVAPAIYEWSPPAVRYILTYSIDVERVRILRVHHARENRNTP